MRRKAESYDKIVGELPEMRAQAVELVAAAVVQKIQAYVLVNNRGERNAPLTIQALVDVLQATQ